jgi:hypothetical protein
MTSITIFPDIDVDLPGVVGFWRKKNQITGHRGAPVANFLKSSAATTDRRAFSRSAGRNRAATVSDDAGNDKFFVLRRWFDWYG